MSEKTPADPTAPPAQRARGKRPSRPKPTAKPTVTLVAPRLPKLDDLPKQSRALEPRPAAPGDAGEMPKIDVEALARNVGRVIEEGGKALAAYMRPREDGKVRDERADAISDVVKTLARVLEYWLADPQ